MYVILTPFEKLAYLSFWRPRTPEEAGKAAGDGAGRMEAAAKKLAGLGLLEAQGGRFAAKPEYLAERIEEDNHLYPERKLGGDDMDALLSLLRSELLAGWFDEDFAKARALEKEGKDVLAGFFWGVMRGPFAVAHAYFLVFGDQPGSAEVRGDFDRFLQERGDAKRSELAILEQALREQDSRTASFTGKDPLALERAFGHGFAFLLPAGVVDYLRWNVNISPSAFIAEDIFARFKAKARIPRSRA